MSIAMLDKIATVSNVTCATNLILALVTTRGQTPTRLRGLVGVLCVKGEGSVMRRLGEKCVHVDQAYLRHSATTSSVI